MNLSTLQSTWKVWYESMHTMEYVEGLLNLTTLQSTWKVWYESNHTIEYVEGLV